MFVRLSESIVIRRLESSDRFPVTGASASFEMSFPLRMLSSQDFWIASTNAYISEFFPAKSSVILKLPILVAEVLLLSKAILLIPIGAKLSREYFPIISFST